jgi:excisionase family DNA binding protein
MESRKHPSKSKDGSINDKLDKLADDIKKLPGRRKELLADMMKKRLYDSLEACEILGISLPSLRRAIQLGRIKSVHVGRFLRIPAEEIERLVQGEEGLLNTEEAGQLLNVSPATIRALIKSGKIQAFRLADAGPFKLLKSEIERIAEGRSQE